MPSVPERAVNKAAIQAALLAWYEAHGRSLPWRVRPQERLAGVRADPYRVWVSEVMLQQTTAAAAAPRFERFMGRFPTLEALAAATPEAVLQAWAGLGYYARARNLHAAARRMAATGTPTTEAGWRALPGVGAYTAAAVAAIALDAPAAPVDANVERVLIRLLALPGERTAQARAARAAAQAWAPAQRAGDWVQALMDLGAMICTPRSPDCPACPVRDGCGGCRSDLNRFPGPKQKPVRPLRQGFAYWLTREDAVWLVRRPASGLLGGMAALPTTEWSGQPPDPGVGAPARARWKACGAIRHVFTHFTLELEVWSGVLDGPEPQGGWWEPLAAIPDAGLPSLFVKAARQAQTPSLARKSRRK